MIENVTRGIAWLQYQSWFQIFVNSKESTVHICTFVKCLYNMFKLGIYKLRSIARSYISAAPLVRGILAPQQREVKMLRPSFYTENVLCSEVSGYWLIIAKAHHRSQTPVKPKPPKLIKYIYITSITLWGNHIKMSAGCCSYRQHYVAWLVSDC